MKRLLAGLAAATFLAGTAFAQAPAQPAPTPTAPTQAAPAAQSTERYDVDPAVWVVRDEDTTIYLFGTFHLLDNRRDWFNDEVRAAFDASSELVVEVAMPEDQNAVAQQMMAAATDEQRRPLGSRISEADAEALRRIMGPIGDQLLQAPLEPWYVSLTLTIMAAQQLGLNPADGPETVLSTAARARNMPISGLETIAFQIGIFDGMSEEAQLRGLTQTLNDYARLRETLEPMLDAWSVGEVDRLAEITNRSMREDPETYRVLFTDRNANWARWIQERMARPGTVFLAVGAGHLGGEGSVQDQLERLNIRSERVPAPTAAQ